MSAQLSRNKRRLRKKKRTGKNLQGTAERPRLSVFRSLKYTYAYVVDDTAGHTLAQASSLSEGIRDGSAERTKKDEAVAIGNLVAEKALKRGVKKVVFDRNGYIYHGRVKAVSDGAREAGLEF